MSEAGAFIGIDVAKGQLDIAARPSGERWQVDNEPDGSGRRKKLARRCPAGGKPCVAVALERRGVMFGSARRSI